MNIEPGLVAVIAATLIFYLRLILLQRERARRLAQSPREAPKPSPKHARQSSAVKSSPDAGYSILSPRRRDWVIAGLGILAILVGIGLNRGLLPIGSLQSYWWAPTAAGIVAFSWAFRL
jgi:hypothetical protein